jgi:hypothetical protein
LSRRSNQQQHGASGQLPKLAGDVTLKAVMPLGVCLSDPLICQQHSPLAWYVPPRLNLQKSLKRGDYLWELISPKDKDGLPARSLTGKYRVKLFLLVSP